MTRNDLQRLARLLGENAAENLPLLTGIVMWLQDDNPRFDEWQFRTWVAVAARNKLVGAKIERSRKRDLSK